MARREAGVSEPVEPVGGRWLTRARLEAEERRARIAFLVIAAFILGLLW